MSNRTSSPKRYLDTISLRELHTAAVIGPDAWNRSGKSQPLVLSLQLTIDTASAGSYDDVSLTFSYGQICKDVISKISGGNFSSIDHLTSSIAELAESWPGETLEVVVLAPKALLRVDGFFGRKMMLRRRAITTDAFKQPVWLVTSHEWFVTGLKAACVIGVNEHERLEKQVVNIGLKVQGEKEEEDYRNQTPRGNEMWRVLVRQVCEIVEASTFQTLEALAALIAQTCLAAFPIPEITVSLEKPSALTFVEGAGVEITRGREFLQQM